MFGGEDERDAQMPDAVETMAYDVTRGVPWHGKGVALEGLSTAKEAAEAAGLTWTAALEPMFLGDGTPVADRFANVRQSDRSTLGIVGKGFVNVQPVDCFDWADNLVDDGSAKYDTMGALMGGRRIFLSMILPEGVQVPGDNGPMDTYLMISNGYDGMTKLRGDVVSVRTVCQNTWTLAIKGATRSFAIRHTGSMEGKLAAAREALGITFEYTEALQAASEKLMALKVSDKQADSVLERVFPIPARAQKDTSKIDSTSFGEVRELYHTSPNLDPIRGTGWSILQAVGEFVDHEMDYHGRRFDDDDVRFDSIMYGGPAAAKKQRAYDILTSRDFARVR
jgi:phage/plasmid-like protein (TIGR03299 family)